MSQTNLPQYSAYKKSDIGWVEQLPSEWRTKRVKEVLREAIYGISEKTNEEGRYEVLGMGDIDNGKINPPGKRFVDNVSEELLLKKGDLLFNRTNSQALVGKVGIVEEEYIDTTFASYLIRLRLKHNQKSKYYCYMLNSERFIRHLQSSAIQTANQANISSSRLKQAEIIVLETKEQQAIADYLDAKTEQIDRKIELLENKAEKYVELKQSLINETVTRGLDKNIPMKDSGVEWIGHIPSHWEVKRVKDLFVERSQKGFPEEPLLIASQDKGVILKSDYSRNTMTVQQDFHLMKLVKKNDFVISLRSFEGGIEIANNQGIISAAYTILSVNHNFSVGYYKHLFKSKRFISMLVTNTTGIREGRNINYQQLKRELLPLPPEEECSAIAEYLNEKTLKIDKIIETINLEIEKLQELRKTLINDVVTGKIRVFDGGGSAG